MINDAPINMVHQALGALPCFHVIKAIAPINVGLSSQCYVVDADGHRYFAKQVSTINEGLVSAAAAQINISPKVIFADEHWLITQYIRAENLAFSQLAVDEKIHRVIEHMALCHNITAKPALLAVDKIIAELITDHDFFNSQQSALLHLGRTLTLPLSYALTSAAKKPLNKANNLVCCHGDLNFSNLLLDTKQQVYVVDFECACTAPAEFDLAMFSAVNNITRKQLVDVINTYQQQRDMHALPASKKKGFINTELFNQYLLFCYFINGLWYFNASQKNHQTSMRTALLRQATEQWQALNLHVEKDLKPLFSRLGIKL